VDRDPVRVLIVEDYQLFADALKLALDRDPSVTVVGVAATAAEAVDMAVAGDAEVVLMDIGLPDADGFEATRRLHAIKAAAKVIAVTGRAEAEIAEEAAAAGMVSYLSKDHIHEHVHAAIMSAAR
jgi:DNA-binding NarL/FixJ family response regulator